LECEKCGYKEYLITEVKDYERCPSCNSLVIGQDVNELPPKLEEIIKIAKENFSFGNIKTDNYSVSFEPEKIYKSPEEIISDFEKISFYPFIRKEGNKINVIIRSAPPKKDLTYRKNLILFVLTIISTTIAGYFLSLPYVENGFMANPWIGAITFSLSLMAILGTHEMGHFFAARKNGVDATLPYFIPLPTFLGTMGAVINIRSFIPSKKGAIELGLSGPLAGILVAIPITIFGIMMSPVVPLSLFGEGSMFLGEPLIFKFIAQSLVTIASDDHTIYLHPVAFAGWVGIFVTMLNLIPMGQLDGGHIARAILGPVYHKYLSFIVAISLFSLGFVSWAGWILWGAIGLFLAYRGHPGAMDEITPLDMKHKGMIAIAIFLFAISAMVTPIKLV
ncbi:MAG: site-2 protease family protein, partial [Candidatus Methanofastidiosa archaeon]|nr:site-2 protease family protein [Candidatus Methanofastidiosa archaeon]